MDALSRRQVRNVAALALGWAMAVGALFITVSSGTAFARELNGNLVATLPVGGLVCLATLTALVCPEVIKLISRRALFITASVLGILGAGLMSYAVYRAHFVLFTIAAVPQGIAFGVSNLYRFYATETSLPQHREKALAAVVGGATLSAFIGPEASRHVRYLLNPDFLGAFLLATGLWVLQLLFIVSVDYRLPKHISAHIKREEAASRGDVLAPMYTESTIMSPVKRDDPETDSARMDVQNPLFKDAHSPNPQAFDAAAAHHDTTVASIAGGSIVEAPGGMHELSQVRWAQIVCRPGFIAGASVAALSFFSMSGLMAAVPLAMAEAGYSVDSSTLVIEAHMIAMYFPSLFSGHLIQSFGAPVVMVLGSVLIVGGNALLFYSQERFVFWVSMILIGVGWNLDYVGSSNALLNPLKHQAEKSLAQAVFDFIALTGLSTAVTSSGFTFDGLGWETMYTVYLGISSLNVLSSVLSVLTRFMYSPLSAYDGDHEPQPSQSGKNGADHMQ